MLVWIYLFLFRFDFLQTSEQWTETGSFDPSLVWRDSQAWLNDVSAWKVRQSRNRASVPQSLTLLMNFKEDGTTSFQIMQGTQIVYVDNGSCGYEQLFDPSTGQCRNIYCQELNYKFNGTTCIPDVNKNASHAHQRMSDIDLTLTSIVFPSSHYQRDSVSKRLNSRVNESCTSNWKHMFRDALHNYLDIDYERISRTTYWFKQDGRAFVDDPVINSRVERSDKQNSVKAVQSTNTLHKNITNMLSNNQSVGAHFNFSIIDRGHGSTNTLPSLYAVTLLLLASESHVVIDLCRHYSMRVQTLSILSDKKKTREEFCRTPDVMYPTKTGIMRRRVRPDGEIDYVVDIPELDTTYEMGDYTYMFIVSTLTQQASAEQMQQTVGQLPLSSSSAARKLVSVCNRQPRIVGRCPDSLVMRIALCEVVQYKNFSVRIKRTGRLYTNHEYRYDEHRPDLYLVVCKHQALNGTASERKLSFMEKAPGILSSVATFLSICALAITLFTFILFSSLRNLPGCNTMNLIVALMIAQTLFLCQSLMIVTKSSVCLFLALGIHFFYLASFFWMNVMAFDLWKTFHRGFSLYVYEIHERLPLYALYAWGMPVIFVLIGIILDAKNARFKPCYGRFFRGCYDVCFQRKNDTPLQGCWIESALMRLILFGCPVAIILIVNFVFYALTVRNIRHALKTVRVQVERKFHRKKHVVPGEHDVKIYMRMAVLAGFGWTIGFILIVLPDGPEKYKRYLSAAFKYLFILLNATPGLFVFVVYVCNRRVLSLYRELPGQIFEWMRVRFARLAECLLSRSSGYLDKTKTKLEEMKKNEHQHRLEELPMRSLSEQTKTPSRSLSSQEHHRLSKTSNSTYQSIASNSSR